MSRLGKIPIPLPSGVEVKVTDGKVLVKGPKGELSYNWIEGLSLKEMPGKVVVENFESSKLPKSMYGLYRALLGIMIEGVFKGFAKELSMIGVGYRANVQGSSLDLFIGKSHPVQLPIPKGISVTVDKNVNIVVFGIDKQAVGEFAAIIRSQLPPEPYKGKGIRYKGEHVRKKAGKAAKAKRAAV